MADEGISTIKEGVAANRFLSGQQAQSAIGALREQQRVAGRATGKLRQAAAEARNQLRHIQAQRASVSRGSGVATGGGGGGGSGTAQMRQDIASAAQQMAAEQTVQGAEMEAAKVGTKVVGEIGKIKQQQQAYGRNFFDNLTTTMSTMVQAGDNPATVGEYVASELGTLDMGDEVQRNAGVRALGAWLAKRGYPATTAELNMIVGQGQASEVALLAGKIAPPAVRGRLKGGVMGIGSERTPSGTSLGVIWQPPQSTTA